MESAASILFALTFRTISFHLFLTSKAEGNRPVNLQSI
jgi:hypothetical protein